jgi:dTDP-glucose 4,6-dehydratase
VDALVTRGSNTYGPNQYPEKVLPLFITNALDGEPLPLYGDGRQIRDWLFVGDHCAGVGAALRLGRAGEIYNIGGGAERENRDITARIIEATDADPALVRHVEDRPGHDRRYSLDTTKARRELSWEPLVTLDEGLARTVAWYRDNRAWWEPIKQSGGYRAYYERQYANRLA